MKSERPNEDDFGALVEQYSDPAMIEFAKKEKAASEPCHHNQITHPKNPQDTLDLHQLSAREAVAKTDEFLRTSKRNGLKTVIVITGKGIHSSGGEEKLRGVVHDKVIELKRQGIVADFKWDQREEKRSGAIIVYLT